MVVKLERRTRPEGPLSNSYDWKKIESEVREFYGRRTATAAVHRSVSKKRPLGYVEGPPTLNNQPHIGHVRGRIMKDIWYRHLTMHGENIVFRGGWDTQGLPVELQAEKEMGLSGNKWDDLRAVGVERLVEACKGLIAKYQGEWVEADRLTGLMLDHGRDYMTYRDAYIEREWKYLETAWKKGLLGEGFKVVPYCPSCQTALSHAEVVEGGYESLEDPSLYYKVEAEDGSSLVVWTTMPFTVLTDEMVGVKPDYDYEYVRVGDEVWVVGSGRKEALKGELGVDFGDVVKKVKGKELEGLRYRHPLIEQLPGLRAAEYASKVHRVVAEEFVDTSAGTGLVHMSPANGEDDFAVATRRGIPVFVPFDDQVRLTAAAGKFAGLFARDADQAVVQALEEAKSVVKSGRLVHEYPVCWRSGHRLVWLARREYFYWVDRMRRELERAAEKVEYFFEPPRNRFLSFIAESPPWCITRERVWGSPLPVWVCESCGGKTAAFSRRAIVRQASELPDGPEFELHRPWIDRVVLRCRACGGRAVREPFVLDTWHNSGASPYASFTDGEYSKLVPVRFLTEGIDQTRGWAYTLLVLNVILSGRAIAPYREFLFQGHVLDEQGRKMSKSLGNVVWGLDVLRRCSVDVLRFYMMWKAPPDDAVSLDLKEMDGRPYQVINTLYHLHVYLAQNGAVDGYSPSKHTLEWARRRKLLTPVDSWLLAKLARSTRDADEAYSSGRYNDACKAVEQAVITYLSQTYVRLVRPQLWRDDPETTLERLAIYAVLGHALKRLDEALHPVSPFVTEYLFQETFGGRDRWRAPLLAKGMSHGGAEPRGGTAEKGVDLALRVEEACNSARTRGGLKRRWPLADLMVIVAEREKRVARHAAGTIEALCNVKRVEVVDSGAFPATVRLVPSPSRFGALFKERTRELLAMARPLAGDDAVAAWLEGKPVVIETKSGRADIPVAAFDLTVTPLEGFIALEKGGVFAALRSRRDDGLVAEGLVRDIARRLQALRKARGFVPSDTLDVAAVSGLEKDEIESLEALKGQIAFLVRVREVVLGGPKAEGTNWDEEDLDGRPIYLDVR